MFLHYINTKQKYIKVFFLPNANKYPHQIFSTSTPLAHTPHPLRCSFSTSLHPLIYSIRQRRENAHESVSISASSSTVPAFKLKFLYYAPHVYNYGVFQALKRKLTLRNMNGSLYCCYQNSPYQFCPHILVFMFKNHTHTHTHTHTMYIITRIFTIIPMFTYENKKYTRSSKLIM